MPHDLDSRVAMARGSGRAVWSDFRPRAGLRQRGQLEVRALVAAVDEQQAAFRRGSNARARPSRPTLHRESACPERGVSDRVQFSGVISWPSGRSQATSFVPASLPGSRRRRSDVCARPDWRVPDRETRRGESEQLTPRLVEIPIDPGQLVVLAVGVVVAAAACARISSPARAWARPARTPASRGSCVACWRVAQSIDRLGSVVAFDAPVAAPVVVVPSRLSSPLASLCLLLVAHQVVQREAVVAGHEVDAGVRPAPARGKESLRARQPRREVRRPSRVTAPEAAHARRDSVRSTRTIRREIRPADTRPGPRSHGSAISFTRDSTGSWRTDRRRTRRAVEVDCARGRASRPRSKRKPSTCISSHPVAQAVEHELQ